MAFYKKLEVPMNKIMAGFPAYARQWKLDGACDPKVLNDQGFPKCKISPLSKTDFVS